MAQPTGRMMATPPARQRTADRTAAVARAAAPMAEASSPTIRPGSAQLVTGSSAAPPGLAVQRIKNKTVAKIMKTKTHTPHGGSKNSNANAAKKGYGQKAGVRKMATKINASQKKRAAGAATG